MRLALAAAAALLAASTQLSDASAENWADHFSVSAKTSSGKLNIVVAAKDGWFVNTEYPMKLKLTAPDGVTLGKTELKKSDATFSGTEHEGKAKTASFSVSATGSGAVDGNYKLVVCSENNCSPPVKGSFTSK